MAINVRYGPTGAALELAAQAGQGERFRQRFSMEQALRESINQQARTALGARQLAGQEQQRLSATMLAQSQQNQDAALKKRAMALQEAAEARRAATPTATQERKELLADAISQQKKAVSELQTGGQLSPELATQALAGIVAGDSQATARALQASRQLQGLETLRQGGVVSDADYKRARAGLLSGDESAFSQLIQGPKEPSWSQQRREAQDRAAASEAMNRISQQLDRGDLTPQQRLGLSRQMVALSNEATGRWGKDWTEQPMASDFSKQQPDLGAGGGQAYKLPPDRTQLKIGRTYYNPKTGDVIGVWTGTRFRSMERLPSEE